MHTAYGKIFSCKPVVLMESVYRKDVPFSRLNMTNLNYPKRETPNLKK